MLVIGETTTKASAWSAEKEGKVRRKLAASTIEVAAAIVKLREDLREKLLQQRMMAAEVMVGRDFKYCCC